MTDRTALKLSKLLVLIGIVGALVFSAQVALAQVPDSRAVDIRAEFVGMSRTTTDGAHGVAWMQRLCEERHARARIARLSELPTIKWGKTRGTLSSGQGLYGWIWNDLEPLDAGRRNCGHFSSRGGTGTALRLRTDTIGNGWNVSRGEPCSRRIRVACVVDR